MFEETAIPSSTALVEREIRTLLALSPAYQQLPEEWQEQFSAALLSVGSYLVEPEGFRANRLRGAFTSVPARVVRHDTGNSLVPVDFPAFVAGLIQGVFQAVVEASSQQMEAYANLLKSVAATVAQFGGQPLTDTDGRDWLATTYPEYFQYEENCHLCFRPGADLAQAVRRLNLTLYEPLYTLDPHDIETVLVPAARSRLARSRQQLLASMVLMGVNRNVSPGATEAGPSQAG